MEVISQFGYVPRVNAGSFWQHCINTTPFNGRRRKSYQARQHRRAVPTQIPCENCDGTRFSARRGGVVRYDNMSCPPNNPAKLPSNNDKDNDGDSGYQSDVSPWLNTESDLDEESMLPMREVPPRVRTEPGRPRKRKNSTTTSISRQPSWKSNGKRNFTLEVASCQRTPLITIDTVPSIFNEHTWQASDLTLSCKETTKDLQNSATLAVPNHNVGRARSSTLLHPSTPPLMDTTANGQKTKSFPFPHMENKRNQSFRRPAPLGKSSTLLHPSHHAAEHKGEAQSSAAATLSPHCYASSPGQRPTLPPRRGSSLLRPSSPPDPAPTAASYRTVISIPPNQLQVRARRPSTLLHPSGPGTSPPDHPTAHPRRLQPVHTISEPQSVMMAQQRRASILHSSLSDTEDESYSDGSHAEVDNIRATLNAFSFARPSRRLRNSSSSCNNSSSDRSNYDEDRTEGAPFAYTANSGRVNRNGDRNGRRM
jgi:hypothetical protein